SLMYFAETVTRLHRRASLATYGAAIHGFVVVVSLLFAFALIHSGAGLALVAVALAIPLLLFADSSSYTYSTYVFFLPLVLLNVAWYTLALLFSWSSTLARHTATIFGAGLLAAFSFNMRTSYLPTYVLFGALYCVFTFRRTHPSLRWPDWRRPALVWVAASIGVYALAIALFHALFIRPLVPARPSNQNYSYHPIAHPLVLSLAFPSNDLARREGILWQDDVGLTLAKRTIPEATYLGPLYEKALFRYYRNLWSAYPGEMARLYFAKF